MEYILTFYNTSDIEIFNCSTSGNTDVLFDGSDMSQLQITKLSYNKEMYMPCCITANIQITVGGSTPVDVITSTFYEQKCSLSSLYENEKGIAKNYYVHEVTVVDDGTPLMIQLKMYSIDNLLNVVEECHSYVGQHLCTDILKDAVDRYTSGTGFKIEANAGASNLQFLKGANGKELIQPYIVQYNETFYSMLARTANRCGEYIFFENGKLNAGLAYNKDNTAIDEEDLSLLSAELPEISAKLIFDDIKMFARDYTLDDGYDTTSPEGAAGIADSIINGLENSKNSMSDSTKEKAEKLIEELKKIQEKQKEYRKTRLYVETYEKVQQLKEEQEEKVASTPYSDVDESEYLSKENQSSLEECEKARNNAQSDYLTKRSERDELSKDLWNEERDKRYKELYDKPASERTPEEQDELDKLAYLLNHQKEINASIAEYDKQLDSLQTIIDKISIYIQIADYQQCLDNIGKDKRTWDGNEYTSTDLLDKAWKDSIDSDTLKKELEDILGDVSGDLKDQIEALYNMLDSNAELTELELGKGSGTFIYDYSTPVDEYLIDYTKDDYACFCPEGNGIYVTASVLNKFLNTPGSWVQSLAMTAWYTVWLMSDLALIRDKANNNMNNAMDGINPNGEESEYKDGDKHRLYSSLDANDKALIRNINNAGMALIRRYEEILKDVRLILTLDTTSNTKQLALGDYVRYDNEEYVVTKMTGCYEGSIYTETIEAVPVQTIEDSKYCIPPMIPAGHVRYAEPQPAKVKANADPQNIGRVQIQYGWQENDSVEKCQKSSPLIRVATPFAGKGGGMFFQLAVGEEVMINYDHGNVERPYVACSLFNSGVKPAMGNDLFSPITRVIRSQNGHKIVFNDLDGDAVRFFAGTGISKIPLAPDVNGLLNLKDDAVKNAEEGEDATYKKQYGGGVTISDKGDFYCIDASTDQRLISLTSSLGNIDMNAFTGININCPFGDLEVYGKNVSIKARNKINVQSGISLSQNWLIIGNMGMLQDLITKVINDYVIDLSLARAVIERFLEPVSGTITEIGVTGVNKVTDGFVIRSNANVKEKIKDYILNQIFSGADEEIYTIKTWGKMFKYAWIHSHKFNRNTTGPIRTDFDLDVILQPRPEAVIPDVPQDLLANVPNIPNENANPNQDV